MRVAIICLAHLGAPAGVRCLAAHFRHPAIDMFLHVDLKVSADPYLGLDVEFPNFKMIQNREDVFWGGFSLVRAIFNSLAEARAEHSYDRFVLISEDTMPLTSVEEMLSAFRDKTEFMNMSRPGAQKALWSRYENFYYFDSFSTCPRYVKLESRVVTERMLDDLTRLKALKSRGKFPLPDLRIASTWWALSASAVELLLKIDSDNQWLRDSFEFSSNPDETYFPTILGVLAERYSFRNFIHVDFSRSPKPYRYTTFDELSDVRKTGLLFTRKVDFGSADVVRFIDALGR